MLCQDTQGKNAAGGEESAGKRAATTMTMVRNAVSAVFLLQTKVKDTLDPFTLTLLSPSSLLSLFSVQVECVEESQGRTSYEIEGKDQVSTNCLNSMSLSISLSRCVYTLCRPKTELDDA